LLFWACGEAVEPRPLEAGGKPTTEAAEGSDPEKVVAEIEELLDEIVAAYGSGDAATAAELSAEAYLENYEHIEDAVIEKAPEVNEELETLLGAELRREIDAGASLDEIKDMTARAEQLLARALEAISEG
jgi:predicted lipid-binding transport protein (Tim44 family)